MLFASNLKTLVSLEFEEKMLETFLFGIEKRKKKDEIRKLFVLYKSKDIGDQNKKDAARWIRDSLLKSKPKRWKGKVYKESTIYMVLKTLK